MADLSNNYGLSEGVDCRNGKPVFNKLSCQSLRVFPAPPGYWEQEVCIPIRTDDEDGRKKWEAIARGMMFSSAGFVSCRHPDCWICMGQEDHPTPEQVAAFKPLPSTTGRRLMWGVLPGEEWLFPGPKRRPKRKRIAALLRRWWNKGVAWLS